MSRRNLWPCRVVAVIVCGLAVMAAAAPAVAGAIAHYRVSVSPGLDRFRVTATIPVAGAALRMDETRPAGIRELDAKGWAGLVTEMKVSDAQGRALALVSKGAAGWLLAQADTGSVVVQYVVDLAPLARDRWPAPREAAFRDSSHLTLVGRALFVTTDASRECRVTFDAPAGWRVTAPWPRRAGRDTFTAGTPASMVENLVLFSREAPDEAGSGGFRVHVCALGDWARARAEVLGAMRRVVRHQVARMGFHGQRDYLVLLLPQSEHGGEAYRSSFALCTEDPASAANRGAWANLLAHELFHQWNGYALQGADYASTQWFQEGFTEYVANTTLAATGLIDAAAFRARLAEHVRNARRLETTLENIGTRKGRPLYSAGALVAFTWDVRIRESSRGRRDLGDFFRELLKRSDGGGRRYAWPDLRDALAATADHDWDADHAAFVSGRGPIPIEDALARVGQRLVSGPADSVRIEADPHATAAAQQRWAALLRGR